MSAPKPSPLAIKIQRAIADNPDKSNRAIALQVGCDPVTVMKYRHKLGVQSPYLVHGSLRSKAS